MFASDQIPLLRHGVADLAWLLGRGYSAKAALKLVGDHLNLRERQRLAVLRSTCTDNEAFQRRARRLTVPQLAGCCLAVDGFNCLITSETALSAGLLLRGRDGALRDLASVHGSYRDVTATRRALHLLGQAIAAGQPARVSWFLDRPVSNSGRLRALLLELAGENNWPWNVELVNNPDHAIADTGWTVATSDAWLLDTCTSWLSLPDEVVDAAAPGAWIVDLCDGNLPGWAES